MATRIPWPSYVAFGAEATSADVVTLPGGWLGVDTATGPITIDTSDDVVISIVVTVGADRFIKITAGGTVSDGDNNSVDGEFWVEEDGVDVGRVHRHPDGDERSYIAGATWSDGPSAGSHTYRLVGTTSAGDMSVTGIKFLVEDIGPASS